MPSLRERLGTWIAGRTIEEERATTRPFAFEPDANTFFGPGIGKQPRFETLLQESRGIFNSAKRTLANRIASLEIEVKRRVRVSDGTVEDETLDDHPLKVLLDRPHPNLSKRQVFRLTTEWLVDTGEAYWLKIGNGFGVPSEVQLAKPGSVWPVIERNTVSHYRVQDLSGQIAELDPEAVIRFFLPDPENPWGAEGYLAPLGIEADSMKFAGEHLRSHYQNDATPSTFLQAASDASVPGSDNFDRFLELWRKYYHNRSGERRGLPGIGPVGYELIQLAMQTGADVTPLLEHWRDDLLMGMGTPRSVLGQVVSGDRSSAETNFYVYDTVTVLPMAELISDALSLQLAPDFDDSLIVGWAPFVSEDKEFQLRKEHQDVSLSVRTPNHVRADRGEDDVPWGDNPLRLNTLGPAGGDGDDGGGGGGSLSDAVDSSPSPSGDDVDLEPDGQDEDERVRGVSRQNDIAATVAAEIGEDDAEEALRGVINTVAREFGQRALDLADVPGEFDLTSPPVAEFFDSGLDAELALVAETTQRALIDAIEDALDDGTACAALAPVIRSVFKHALDVRVFTIARTTTVQAANFGMTEGLEQGGIVLKDWVSQRDAHVRETHEELDAEDPIPVNELFVSSNSGFAAPHPGAFGVAEEDVNCRCFVVPAGPGIHADDAGRMWVGEEQRGGIWRQLDKERVTYEGIAVRALRRMFQQQQRQALAALKGCERALHIMVRQMIRGGRAA